MNQPAQPTPEGANLALGSSAMGGYDAPALEIQSRDRQIADLRAQLARLTKLVADVDDLLTAHGIDMEGPNREFVVEVGVEVLVKRLTAAQTALRESEAARLADKGRLDWLEARKHVEIECGRTTVCLTQGERVPCGTQSEGLSGHTSSRFPVVMYPYRFQGDLRSAIDQQRAALDAILAREEKKP